MIPMLLRIDAHAYFMGHRQIFHLINTAKSHQELTT